MQVGVSWGRGDEEGEEGAAFLFVAREVRRGDGVAYG